MQLKIGFIGLGAISNENVLGYLDTDDAEIVAICDPDENAAHQWRQRWELPKATYYRDHETMLATEQFDIVEILTPHHLHCAHAIACAEAKTRAISLQKPMAMTLQECDRIIVACRESNVRLKVYENFLFYPVYHKAKHLIDQGLIGELMSIRINTLGGIRDAAEWPRCWGPSSWRADLELAGVGPLVGDDGFHKFALARWFMDRDFETISAWIDADTPLDAPAYIRVRFKRRPDDGPKYAQIDFSFSTNMALPSEFWLDDFIEIVGEKGVMWINQCSGAGDRALFRGCTMSESPVFPPIAVFVDGKVTTYLADMSPAERNWSTSFVASTRHFMEVIKAGGEPIFTGEEGKEITRYVIAAYVSAQQKRDIPLDEITSATESQEQFKIMTNFCNIGRIAKG